MYLLKENKILKYKIFSKIIIYEFIIIITRKYIRNVIVFARKALLYDSQSQPIFRVLADMSCFPSMTHAASQVFLLLLGITCGIFRQFPS